MKKVIAFAAIVSCLPLAAFAQYEDLDWSTKKKIAFYLPNDDVSQIKPKDFKKISGSYEQEWTAANVLGAMSEKGRTMWGPSGFVDVTFDSFDRDYAWILQEAKEQLLEKAEVDADIENSKKRHAEFLKFDVYVNCADKDVWDIREKNYWRIWLLDENQERVYPLEIVEYEGYPEVSKKVEKVGLMGVEYKYTYHYAGFSVKFPNFYGERRPSSIKLIMAGELGQHGFEWLFDKNPE